jgi:hypothetical protein
MISSYDHTFVFFAARTSTSPERAAADVPSSECDHKQPSNLPAGHVLEAPKWTRAGPALARAAFAQSPAQDGPLPATLATRQPVTFPASTAIRAHNDPPAKFSPAEIWFAPVRARFPLVDGCGRHLRHRGAVIEGVAGLGILKGAPGFTIVQPHCRPGGVKGAINISKVPFVSHRRLLAPVTVTGGVK